MHNALHGLYVNLLCTVDDSINILYVGLPTMSDYLIAYATIPNRPAFRNDDEGSYFILELDEVFRKMAAKEQLIDMLTEVNRRMADRRFKRGKYKQQPHFVSALRKKLYFNPGKHTFKISVLYSALYFLQL